MVALIPIPGAMNEAVVLTQHEEKVWRISLDGSFAPILYGDLSGLVGGGGFEEGLLALAFAPGFPADNRVYAYYTQGSPQPSVLSRFNVVGGVINVGSAEPLLSVPQPYQNHNGGQLAFGPDGYLYLSLGDGGGAGDPEETGQVNTDFLGSVLRIDVSGPTGYMIPASNPYVGVDGADEVWAYGFRNPWRFSFDTYTGDLWLADVGQGWWEEIDKVVAGGNYGWDVMEGPACYEPSSGCDQTGKILPVHSYTHSGGACSVTGGFVYHGTSMPELAGWYIYADYCTGQVWALDVYGNNTNIQLLDMAYFVTSFGQAQNGEIYIVTPQNGIFRLMR
jgi:glucose/arabinose dehydrogenase